MRYCVLVIWSVNSLSCGNGRQSQKFSKEVFGLGSLEIYISS